FGGATRCRCLRTCLAGNRAPSFDPAYGFRLGWPARTTAGCAARYELAPRTLRLDAFRPKRGGGAVHCSDRDRPSAGIQPCLGAADALGSDRTARANLSAGLEPSSSPLGRLVAAHPAGRGFSVLHGPARRSVT